MILNQSCGANDLMIFNKHAQWFWCKCSEDHTSRNTKFMLFYFKDGRSAQWSEMTCSEMKIWDMCSTILHFWALGSIINQSWHKLTSQPSISESYLYSKLVLGWDFVVYLGLSKGLSAHRWWNRTKTQTFFSLCIWHHHLLNGLSLKNSIFIDI